MSRFNRKDALRAMRIAQVAGLALIALVIGAILYRPSIPAPAVPTSNTTTDPNQTSTAPAPVQTFQPDASTLGDLLNQVAGVLPEEQTPEPITPTTAQNHTPETTPSSHWKYLGGIFEPDRKLALVAIDDTQRMVHEGQALERLDIKVVSIGPDAIEILREGVPERIERSHPSGAVVSAVAMPETEGDSVLVPGRPVTEMTNEQRLRENATGANPDIAKRRAEFQRRLKEREARQAQRGGNR